MRRTIWSVQDAKNRFSEVVEAARRKPQTVTKRGKPAVVMVDADEYDRLRKLQQLKAPSFAGAAGDAARRDGVRAPGRNATRRRILMFLVDTDVLSALTKAGATPTSRPGSVDSAPAIFLSTSSALARSSAALPCSAARTRVLLRFSRFGSTISLTSMATGFYRSISHPPVVGDDWSAALARNRRRSTNRRHRPRTWSYGSDAQCSAFRADRVSVLYPFAAFPRGRRSGGLRAILACMKYFSEGSRRSLSASPFLAKGRN